MADQVWHRHVYTSNQETPCGVILATALTEGTGIRVPQKEGHFVLPFCGFFFERTPLCPVLEAGSFHVLFS